MTITKTHQKAASRAFNIREVWNPVYCHGEFCEWHFKHSPKTTCGDEYNNNLFILFKLLSISWSDPNNLAVDPLQSASWVSRTIF